MLAKTSTTTATDHLGLKPGDLDWFAELAVWLDPGRQRQEGEYLRGPVYERLRMAGLIRLDHPDGSPERLEQGVRLRITEIGVGVLDEMRCRPAWLNPAP